MVVINRLKDPPTWLKVATTLEKLPTPTHNFHSRKSLCKWYQQNIVILFKPQCVKRLSVTHLKVTSSTMFCHKQNWNYNIQIGRNIMQTPMGWTLDQVMAWCLMAPSHYLNQCWYLINLLRSPKNMYFSQPNTNQYDAFEIIHFK